MTGPICPAPSPAPLLPAGLLVRASNWFDRNLLFYCVPAKAYEALMDRLDDLELNLIADARLRDGQTPIKVVLDDL